MSNEQLDHIGRLIDNSLTALNNCHKSGSAWGIQHWENVYRYLLRKYKRLS